LALLLALSAPGRTQSTTTVVVVDTAAPAPEPRWIKRGASLLYQDAAGDIVNEIPLSHTEEAGEGRQTVRDITGEICPNGRFSYIFDKSVVWNASKTKVMGGERVLKVYGTDGQMIWQSSNADAPEGQMPLLFADDGETMLVLLHKINGWTVSIRDYLGNPKMEAGPFAKLEAANLTASGRYVMARWLIPDQIATHTFLDLKTKTRKDIPSGDLYLGKASINEDGKVVSGKKVVFDFNAPPQDKKP
jgi:hypothetical protein